MLKFLKRFFRKDQIPNYIYMTNEELLSKMEELQKQDSKLKKKHHYGVLVDEILKREILPQFFLFRDQNTDIDHLLPLCCSTGDFSEWFDEDISTVGHSSVIEADFGVHDILGYVTHEREAFGFTSYEVEEVKIPELLDRWKERLVIENMVKPETKWLKIKSKDA